MKSYSAKKGFWFLPVLFVLALCAQGALAAKDAGKSNSVAASSAPDRATIHFGEIAYDFGRMLEGAEVEHDYVVKNTGTATLTITGVRTSCGCTIAHFDKEIRPGGEGKVALKVNLKGFQGKISKTAAVSSNDPQNPEVTLKIDGTVVALIDVKPTSNVIFRGMADQTPETVLDLEATSVPFHISSTETNLSGNISYKLETVEDGKQYRIRLLNQTKKGNYAGYIKLITDLQQKPELFIRVSGFIEGEISVKPQTILIGKLSANQPERTGRVVVTGNRSKSFQITKLGYDEHLLSVAQEQLEGENGYSLEVSPKLESVPVGSRQQTTLTIETDLNPGAKDEVQIHLFNSSDQPEAKTAPK
jgi:hypothetical protein